MGKQYTVDCYGKTIPPEPLKPCPFCGAEATFIVGINLFHVKCTKCGMGGLHATKAVAICRAWNQRVKVPNNENKKKW